MWPCQASRVLSAFLSREDCTHTARSNTVRSSFGRPGPFLSNHSANSSSPFHKVQLSILLSSAKVSFGRINPVLIPYAFIRFSHNRPYFAEDVKRDLLPYGRAQLFQRRYNAVLRKRALGHHVKPKYQCATDSYQDAQPQSLITLSLPFRARTSSVVGNR